MQNGKSLTKYFNLVSGKVGSTNEHSIKLLLYIMKNIYKTFLL